MDTSGQKILICGANGVLGYALARLLAAKDRRILLSGIEEKSPTADDLTLPYTVLDIADRKAVMDLVKRQRPRIIINAAAYTSVDGCESQQELSRSINTLGPGHLAEACASIGSLLVHYSSDYIFNGEAGPYSEEAETDPPNEYGRQKLEAENRIRKSGCDHLILRTNVLFGSAPDERASFVSFVVNSLKAGKTINIVDDQFNNPTWSDDLAEATCSLLQQNARGIFNFGGSEYMHRLDFARLIAGVYNLDSSLIRAVSTESLGLPAPRPLRGGLKNDKITQYKNIPERKLGDILQIMKGVQR